MTLLPHHRIDADVAVIGAGFSGALAAIALSARGQRVVLIERGRHPRFAIGESTTPLTNLLLEEFATKYELPQLSSFSKWGTWQRDHADIACGLKRGFTFLFHRPGEVFADTASHDRQLLVAASPHDHVADTHWYRPEFDQALVEEATRAGAIYIDETAIAEVRYEAGRMRLEGGRHGRSVVIDAGFVIDAGGARGLMSSTLGGGSAPLRWLPPTQGLYSHFTDVAEWASVAPTDGTPPYPPDAAALHHVFPGGWIWMLRFNNGITSAGAALTDAVAAEIGASDGEPAWNRLLERLPSVREQFRDARPTLPFIHAPRVAYRSRQVAGPGWAMLPSAAGVIDPLLSTGFPLTLLGLMRLLNILESSSPGAARNAALADYTNHTQDELDITEQLVAALYANMDTPAIFTRLSLLYFAAASFSEAARRLGRPHLAPGFLLHAHPRFGDELRACAREATKRPTGDARQDLFHRIDRAIIPFDVAGFADRSRQNWYPALASDLLSNAAKLDASTEEAQALLAKCGFIA
ncbi:MAG: FAD-dependent oxidoreductase [Acidobacteriota bacterium]